MSEPSERDETRWLRAALGDLRAAGRLLVEADDRSIALFAQGGRIIAIDNACPHAGNPLIEGELLGDTLVCAFHGWRFDLESGACLVGLRTVSRYPVELREDEVWIDLEPPGAVTA